MGTEKWGQTSDNRKLAVGKRASPDETVSAKPASFNRSKSIERALTVVSLLEAEGIETANIVTIGHGLEPVDVTLANKSVVEIIIYPMGAEVAEYPEPRL